MTAAAHAAPAAGARADEGARTRPYTADIDIGGTLTDGLFSDGATVTPAKVDTTPHDFTVCFFECLKEGARLLGFEDLTAFLQKVAVIRWSATIATNIIAEHKGPRIGLLVSEGTSDELYGDARSKAVGRLISPDNIVALSRDASDLDTLAAVRALLEKGVRRIAVSVAGGFEDSSREHAVRQLIDDNFPDHYLGAVPVVLGSEICRHPDDQTRTHMALVNAYVHTPLAVALFKAEDQLMGEHNYRRPVYIAHVNGGVARVAKTKAVDTAESSPYFGLSACAWWSRVYGFDRVLALDVGGTTAKLGVVVDGRPLTVENGDLLGVPLKTPWTLLRSDAVGGGSIAKASDGAVALGPESQGAFPGPACYDLGGRSATLTDAFLVAGMLNPERFLDGRRTLRRDLSVDALRRDVAEPLGLDVAAAAERVVDRAAQMVAGIAEHTLDLGGLGREGFELFCFGGNGGNFAARVADRLGLDRAFVFGLGPVLSAFGSSVTEICHVHEEWPFLALDENAAGEVARLVDDGLAQVRRDLEGEGLSVDDARFEVELTVARDGRTEEHAAAPSGDGARAAVSGLLAGGGVIDRVSVRGYSPVPTFHPHAAAEEPHAARSAGTRVLGGVQAGILVWEDLRPGATASGPAVLESGTNSCTVPAGWSVRIDGYDNAILRRGEEA
jgi:N-methylhydantoinase A/oxoprolinase/acetone carboxylase beta subunit